MQNNISVDSIKSDGEQNVCKICLEEFPPESMHILEKCGCSFCRNCLSKYFQFMIDNGHFRIYCPSFKCMHNNSVTTKQISELISAEHNQKFQVLINNKVMNERLEKNQTKIRCPFCDQIFDINVQEEGDSDSRAEDEEKEHSKDSPKDTISSLKCPNCLEIFCATCHLKITEDVIHKCNDLSQSVLNEFDIKKCPNCNYLIQREGGCAQISCRNCSHVFCWHCLKSLENDFLLFHYDSGACKNKLGHSRLSIFFNRVQTISICIGISILMILASPIILMTLPCLLTSKCRMCCRRRKDSQV